MRRRSSALSVHLILLVLCALLVPGPAAVLSKQGASGEVKPKAPAKKSASPRRPSATPPRAGRTVPAPPMTALMRAERAKDYLVNTRGIDASRIVGVDGGTREEASTELYICPAGASPPVVSERRTPDTQASFQFAAYRAPLQTAVPGAFARRIVTEQSNAPISGATIQFINQAAPGSRCTRTSNRPNQPPTVNLTSSQAEITLPCREGFRSLTCTPSNPASVQLTANASDPNGDALLYTWSTTGGRIFGEGASVTWDLTGVAPGTYAATTEVDDRHGCLSFSTTFVSATECTDCLSEEEIARRAQPVPCPTITVDCPTSLATPGRPVTFTANISSGDPTVAPTYNWTVSAGTIASGQGTSALAVDTSQTGGLTITASVRVGGFNPRCITADSCSVSVSAPPVCRKFDEYGNVNFADEQARLDNFASQLQNEPGAQGYIIVHPRRARVASVDKIIEGWFLQAALAPARRRLP